MPKIIQSGNKSPVGFTELVLVIPSQHMVMLSLIADDIALLFGRSFPWRQFQTHFGI